MTYAYSRKIARDPSIQGRLKSKRTFLLLLVLLCVHRSCSTVSNIVWSNVNSLTVERKISDLELFTLHMKAGHQCTNRLIADWCAALQGHFMMKPPCTCSCRLSPRFTFIPSMQSCINKTLAARFGGCSRYFGQDTLLAYPNDPVNVMITTARAFPVSSAKSCILSQDYFIHDYNGFQKSWIRASDGFFNLSMTKNAGYFDIKWQSVSTVPETLTGRIVRLMVTCSKGSSSSSGCVLLKVGGTVTYFAPGMSSKISATSSFVTGTSSSYLLSSSLSSSSEPPVLTSSFSVKLPATSVLLPSPSVPKTSNAGMPLPASKTKLQSLSDDVSGKVTTKKPHLRSSMAVHPVGPSSSLSSSSVPPVLTSSSFSVMLPATSALLPSPSVPKTSNSGMPLPASKTKLQSLPDDVRGKVTTKKPHLLSSMAVHPVGPLETTSLVSASSTAVINKPGGHETEAGGKDNGVVIGAAVGSAVVLGAVIVIIFVLWKRRRAESMKRPGKEPKEANEIPLERLEGSQTMPSSQQDSPLYQGLVISNENSNGTGIYSSPEGYYDYCNVYQNLEKKKPGNPVYQSLNASQGKTPHTTALPKNSPRTSITGAPNSKAKLPTGTPKSKPGATGNPYQTPIVPSEPYAAVHRPGPQRESLYEPLREPSQDLYAPLG